MKKIIAIALCSSLATAMMYCSSQEEKEYTKEETDSLNYGKPAGYEGVVEESKALEDHSKK